MIRKMEIKDIEEVMDIWLDANREAHRFIPETYWTGNREAVREQLPQAEVYVLEDGGNIQGFTGLDGEYIAGIFVKGEVRSQGIGKGLLDHAKKDRERLMLHVYQKNTRAVEFYRREDFQVESEGTDEATGEKEWVMVWEQK